jgi:hypothetical protein
MIKIENVVLPSAEQWRAIIMGTRNPMNSWEKSDSRWSNGYISDKHITVEYAGEYDEYQIGPNDQDLMMRLRNSGTDHRKFMRMIAVYVDILAPLYWWKEFDTYKVGTVANSCSTMHKIHEKEFTLEDFSCEHLMSLSDQDIPYASNAMYVFDYREVMRNTIDALNNARTYYLETKDKKYWWQMIQLLPSSYNQKRTVMLNYEVLANIYKSRRNHKLDEWVELCKWIESLPYSELITGEKK